MTVGQTTEHRNIRITVMDIVDNNCSIQTEHMPTFARIRFTNLADTNSKCEIGPAEGSAFFLGGDCEWLKTKGIEFVGVAGINTQDKWVYFDAKR
jgi:hypothetical protein